MQIILRAPGNGGDKLFCSQFVTISPCSRPNNKLDCPSVFISAPFSPNIKTSGLRPSGHCSHSWSIANRKTYPRLPRELSILATETCNLHREKKDRGIGKWQIPYSRVYSKNMIPCYPRLPKVFPVCLFSVLKNILVPLKNKLSGYSVSWNPWVAFYISCCSPKLQNHLLFLNSLRKLHIKRK